MAFADAWQRLEIKKSACWHINRQGFAFAPMIIAGERDLDARRDKLRHATRICIISTKPTKSLQFKFPHAAHPTWHIHEKISSMKIADKTWYRNRLFADRHGAARKYAKHETFK
ncbi:hypothetical protein HMPREF1640_06765 [Prevotella sp. S7-1-8]|nr:hypothetical protein HMPREF1640_06765 [Prevotella sp. S7-1-8]